VLIDNQQVGWVGEIHPLVLGDWNLTGTVAGFELDLDAVTDRLKGVATYQEETSFPSVREDLAVIVPETVSAQQVVDTIRQAGHTLLRNVDVFDAYRDPERIGRGNVSLALHLEFRARDRTLTDEEVAQRRRAITQALAEKLAGRVRDA
jgi:phenylalanyl-tRNA synthetase beta chain